MNFYTAACLQLRAGRPYCVSGLAQAFGVALAGAAGFDAGGDDAGLLQGLTEGTAVEGAGAWAACCFCSCCCCST